MRILEIGKYYAPQRGGMETALVDLCEGLAGRGHQVRAVVASPDDRTVAEKVGRVEVRRVASWGVVRSVPVCPSLPATVRAALRDFRPDLMHLHLPHPLGALAVLSARSDVPLLLSYHSDIVRQRRLLRLWSPVGRRLLDHAQRIHVTSQALVDTSPVLAPYRDRCVAVPLGVRTERFARPDPARVQQWIDELGPDFVLFVGRLVYYKGLDVLFEALRGTSIRVVIAGEGPMRTEWETLSRVLGVAAQVRFLGEVSDRALPALYGAARAFVLPSQEPSEAFGLVQLEAMAAGLPMVVCRASEGVVSVHEEGRTALLVPTRDPDALRSALLRVCEDEGEAAALGRAAQKRVRAFYALEHCVARMESLMLALIGRSRAA